MDLTLDHLVEVAWDFDAACGRAEKRFGRAADWRGEGGGARTAEWRSSSGALEVLAPDAAPPAEKLGLKSLVLHSTDVAAAHARLAAAGLEPGEVSDAEGVDAGSGARRSWRRFRVPDAHLGGLKLFVLQRDAPPRVGAGPRITRVTVEVGDEGHAARPFGGALGLERRGEGYGLCGVELALVARGGPRHRIAGFTLSSEG